MALEPPRLLVEPLQRASSSSRPSFAPSGPPTSARGWSRHRPSAAPGRDAGPCRHGRRRSAPDRRNGRARRARPRPPSPAPARCARRRPASAAARRSRPGRDRPPPRACRAAGARSTSLGADVVMRRHDEVRQQRLSAGAARRSPRLERRELARDAVGPERRRELELAAARGFGAAVGQVDDLALPGPVDRRMRLVDEARQPLRKPVIAARLPAVAVHALLHDRPTGRRR